ncbi:conserved protein of unknown function [Pseudomonas marincola]|uniref:Uncharacterized protein n=1 Tax=Pseudomonas marincola TaxID=437900 RepID=A0A653E0Z6_9PSED|nr:conserved protein of unknown function [Pseudomonas marincola]
MAANFFKNAVISIGHIVANDGTFETDADSIQKDWPVSDLTKTERCKRVYTLNSTCSISNYALV